MAGPRLRPTNVAEPSFALSNGRILDHSVRVHLRAEVEAWERRHGRGAPWRTGAPAFAVLISELLLQRTGYQQVAKAVGSLMKAYPTPESLAVASREEMSSLVAPLGLERRVDVLIECAKAIVNRFQGSVPRELDSLLSLPGVGNYVARATRCLAFGEPAGALDSAVGRMFRRLFGLATSVDAGYDRELWALAEWLASETDAVYFCGLVDIAGDVCRSKPRCSECPFASDCVFVRTSLEVG